MSPTSSSIDCTCGHRNRNRNHGCTQRPVRAPAIQYDSRYASHIMFQYHMRSILTYFPQRTTPSNSGTKLSSRISPIRLPQTCVISSGIARRGCGGSIHTTPARCIPLVGCFCIVTDGQCRFWWCNNRKRLCSHSSRAAWTFLEKRSSTR